MKNIHTIRRARVGRLGIGALTIIAFGATGCLGGSYTTSRDKTLKGAGIGAAAGALAGAVSNYFVSGGVDTGRMTAIGFGQDHPVAQNRTEAGRRLNRRVAILIKGKAR